LRSSYRGQFVRKRKRGNRSKTRSKFPVLGNHDRVDLALDMEAKARVNSLGLCARTTSTIKLKEAAAACIAGIIGLLTGLSGFESAAGREMLGHASLSSSSRFALSCGRKKVDPVRLASGLARFETRPVAMASPLIAITMGIVAVPAWQRACPAFRG
jgi:hypothetical protein